MTPSSQILTVKESLKKIEYHSTGVEPFYISLEVKDITNFELNRLLLPNMKEIYEKYNSYIVTYK